jgi:hypothetical protein
MIIPENQTILKQQKEAKNRNRKRVNKKQNGVNRKATP